MFADAEKYKNDDENLRKRIASKNVLEGYALNTKSTVEDDKLRDKISEYDKEKILKKCNETITWLDNNQAAEKDEFEHRQKELEKICSPIIKNLY